MTPEDQAEKLLYKIDAIRILRHRLDGIPIHSDDIAIVAAAFAEKDKALAARCGCQFQQGKLIIECGYHQGQFAELKDLRAENERLKKALDRTIGERDRREDVIDNLSTNADCIEERSNQHEHGQCIADKLADLRSQLAETKAILDKFSCDEVAYWRKKLAKSEKPSHD